MKRLADHIRELRLARGLTQQALAGKVGVDDTYISKIERDTLPYPPSTPTLQRLAHVLEGDPLEFIALAKRAPAGFETLTAGPAAREFLRLASQASLAEEDWVKLTAFLNRRRARKGRSP